MNINKSRISLAMEHITTHPLFMVGAGIFAAGVTIMLLDLLNAAT